QVEAPLLSVVATNESRCRRPVTNVVAPELDRNAFPRAFQQSVAACVLRPPEASDEDCVVARVGVAETAEHAGVEADPEVFRGHSLASEPRHEVRERGQDEVEM